MRYLKATLLIGSVTCLIVAALYESGAFARMDMVLWGFLGGLSAEPPQRSLVQYVAFVLMAFGIAWTTVDIAKRLLKFVVAVGALLNVISAVWVLNFYYYFFSPFATILALLLSFGFGFWYSRSAAGRRKQMLRLMFGDRLSRKTFYSLVNSSQPLSFEGQECEASVVVCEIFNHEELMEGLPVTDYVAMTNLFLGTASDFLVEKGAYLDECDGESLRVIFGAPLAEPEHARLACEAALDLQLRLDNLNRECDAKWHKMLDYRIGINSGDFVTAAYGSQRLATFSVAGEPVEFASRLCVANTVYGTRILIGAGTLALASDAIVVRPMELVRGRDQIVREEIYELLARNGDLPPEELERRDRFWTAIIYFREHRWDEASAELEHLLETNPTDLPVQFYLRRIEHIRTGVAPALQWSASGF